MRTVCARDPRSWESGSGCAACMRWSCGRGCAKRAFQFHARRYARIVQPLNLAVLFSEEPTSSGSQIEHPLRERMLNWRHLAGKAASKKGEQEVPPRHEHSHGARSAQSVAARAGGAARRNRLRIEMQREGAKTAEMLRGGFHLSHRNTYGVRAGLPLRRTAASIMASRKQ